MEPHATPQQLEEEEAPFKYVRNVGHTAVVIVLASFQLVLACVFVCFGTFPGSCIVTAPLAYAYAALLVVCSVYLGFACRIPSLMHKKNPLMHWPYLALLGLAIPVFFILVILNTGRRRVALFDNLDFWFSWAPIMVSTLFIRIGQHSEIFKPFDKVPLDFNQQKLQVSAIIA